MQHLSRPHEEAGRRGVRRASRLAATVLAAAVIGIPATTAAASTPVPAGTMASLAAALQMSADLGHGRKVSAAASAPGGPIVPEGCRNFGHWVSSEARGTTCADNPRPARGPKD